MFWVVGLFSNGKIPGLINGKSQHAHYFIRSTVHTIFFHILFKIQPLPLSAKYDIPGNSVSILFTEHVYIVKANRSLHLIIRRVQKYC